MIRVEIEWSDLGIMHDRVMFSEVVCKIFLTWVQMDSELFLATLSAIRKYHISMDLEHCFLTVSLMNLCGCLQVSHFSKNEMDDFSLFVIDKESTKFSSVAVIATRCKSDMKT